MKPLLDDFNPEMTSVYDECLKGIAHDQYLERTNEVKAQYGWWLLGIGILIIRCRNAQPHDRTQCGWVLPSGAD